MTLQPGRPSVPERELLAELADLYDEASRLYGDHDCPRSTECCRFGLTGREPYVTSIELCAIERALGRRGGPLPRRLQARPLVPQQADEGICPLLDRRGCCAVYEQRPLGCRTHWCRRATSYGRVGHREIRRLVHRLQAIAARHVPGGDVGRPLRKALQTRGR